MASSARSCGWRFRCCCSAKVTAHYLHRNRGSKYYRLAVRASDGAADSIELKLLMSATEPGALAQLRSAIREAMLEWLRTDLPGALCVDT